MFQYLKKIYNEIKDNNKCLNLTIESLKNNEGNFEILILKANLMEIIQLN